MKPSVVCYNRVQYAGNLFRTVSSQKNIKTDDSHIRVDYYSPVAGGGREKKRAYGTIVRLFMHSAYPGGPERLVVEGQWYEPVGVCQTSKNNLVRENTDYYFNTSSKFAFMDQCCRMPLCVWPYDPLDDLPNGDHRKDWRVIIDRNQEELE